MRQVTEKRPTLGWVREEGPKPVQVTKEDWDPKTGQTLSPVIEEGQTPGPGRNQGGLGHWEGPPRRARTLGQLGRLDPETAPPREDGTLGLA